MQDISQTDVPVPRPLVTRWTVKRFYCSKKSFTWWLWCRKTKRSWIYWLVVNVWQLYQERKRDLSFITLSILPSPPPLVVNWQSIFHSSSFVLCWQQLTPPPPNVPPEFHVISSLKILHSSPKKDDK